MTRLLNTLHCCSLLLAIFATAGCTRHQVEIKPVEVKPIHITIDVNVRIDRDLDDYFGDLDEIQTEQ